MERSLQKSEARYRELVDLLPQAVFEIDEEGHFLFSNHYTLESTGFSQEDLDKDMNAFQLLIPEDRDRFKDNVQMILNGDMLGLGGEEYTALRKDGSTFPVAIYASPIIVEGKPVGLRGAVVNISERRQAEERLEEVHSELVKKNRKLNKAYAELKETQARIIQQEKLASIGQLAAGVAHEINNPTGFVSSNLQTLSDYQKDVLRLIKEYRKLIADLKETVDVTTYPNSIIDQVKRVLNLESDLDIDFIMEDTPNLIKESQEGTERIKKIVIDLKDFAHPAKQELSYSDINHNLESTLNIVWNELKYKAKVTKEYGELPQIRCYPQQLNQVFMNILINAAQAIQEQGEIRIVTRADDGHVEIKISDTGVGIPAEEMSKIFDPFFTTKEVGKGTGLGLNVAYNIIKKHNGTIDVESEVGKGTTFTIRIPA